MSKYSDNCFLFLGKTGVGKSLCAKCLTTNKNIIVSDKMDSCTYDVKGYDAYIPSSFMSKEFYYKVIDTPGLCDSMGRDNNIIDKIKTYLENKSIKVKGIFIFLNFRNVRFDKAEKDIIKKIYNLVPMDHFWKYVTIVFTNYYGDKHFKLEAKRKQNTDSFRKSFEELIYNAYEEEAIIKISTKDLRIEYIDLYNPDKFDDDPQTKDAVIKENKIYLDSLKKIFKELSNRQPLYSKIEDKILENQKVIKRLSDGKANLYNCKIKKFFYYDQQGHLIKEKGKIIEEPQYIKDIELNRLSVHSWRALFTSIGAYVASAGCIIGSCVFPPAAPALLPVGGVLYGVGASANVVQLGTTISDIVENKTYNNTEDISKYDNKYF